MKCSKCQISAAQHELINGLCHRCTAAELYETQPNGAAPGQTWKESAELAREVVKTAEKELEAAKAELADGVQIVSEFISEQKKLESQLTASREREAKLRETLERASRSLRASEYLRVVSMPVVYSVTRDMRETLAATAPEQ